MLQQMEKLKLSDVEETEVELGRGSYGVVVEVIVKGLRYILSVSFSSLNTNYVSIKFTGYVSSYITIIF